MGNITVDQAKENLIKKIHENEQANPKNNNLNNDDLTTEREFKILAGRVVEFICLDGLKLNVPPVKIKDYELYLEILKHQTKLHEPEFLKKAVESILKFLMPHNENLTFEKLWNVIDFDDVKSIMDILSYGQLNGPLMLKKKVVSESEILFSLKTGVVS